MDNKRTSRNPERSVSTGAYVSQRQAALDNLRRMDEAVEKFSRQVKDGKIAPPTSAGRWK